MRSAGLRGALDLAAARLVQTIKLPANHLKCSSENRAPALISAGPEGTEGQEGRGRETQGGEAARPRPGLVFPAAAGPGRRPFQGAGGVNLCELLWQLVSLVTCGDESSERGARAAGEMSAERSRAGWEGGHAHTAPPRSVWGTGRAGTPGGRDTGPQHACPQPLCPCAPGPPCAGQGV